jgi:hypothetical protein
MVISASKVSSLCTGPEIALVMASRPPELNQLTHSQLKRLIARARKMSDKWQDRARSKARAKSRKFGSGSAPPRLTLKSQVISDALKSFEARLARLAESPVAAAARPKPKSKRIRQAGHRATRANVRKSLAGHKSLR